MEKFSNVDILAALDAIMRQNTGFYQDQFQNDRQTITEAAASPAKDDKTLLWVSAPAGTCCETEKDLLIRENVEYGRFRVFAEGVRLDGDKALCYAVKITGAEGGKITGDLYRLDYLEQLARLSDVALPAPPICKPTSGSWPPTRCRTRPSVSPVSLRGCGTPTAGTGVSW